MTTNYIKESGAPEVNEDTVIEGINSLLSMFEIIGQPLFPRNIMCGKYSGFFTVHTLENMYDIFKKEDFVNCRISAYPPVQEGKLLIPNLLLLDMDYDAIMYDMNGRDYAERVSKTNVNKLLKKIQEKHNIRNFMVMHTGHGRHILIPFLFDSPFEELKEFDVITEYMEKNNYKHKNIIGEKFLLFAKKYLSDNQSDEGNHPNFKSIFLRVPGTLNVKTKYDKPELVRIEHEWSYDENTIASFGDIVHSSTKIFYTFISDVKLQIIKNVKRENQNEMFSRLQIQKRPTRKYLQSSNKWIEVLWNTAVSDCRKRIIWLVLAPYAINIVHMSHKEAFWWILSWAEKSNKVTPFDLNYDIESKIHYYLEVAEENGHYPLSFSKIRKAQWKMVGGIDLYDLIHNKMIRGKPARQDDSGLLI